MGRIYFMFIMLCGMYNYFYIEGEIRFRERKRVVYCFEASKFKKLGKV